MLLGGPIVQAAFVAFRVVVVAPSSKEVSAAVGSFAELVVSMVRRTSCTYIVEEAVTDAIFVLMPCALLQQISVADTVAFWMQRCCHECEVDCNVGRREALPDAIRVDIAGRPCLE